MVQAVDNALRVLFAVADGSGGEVTLTSLSQRLGLPKANVLRFLRDLENHGLIARDEERKVSLGFSVLKLAVAFERGAAIGAMSLPYLRWLCNASGETAALQIALGAKRACIEQVETTAEVKWAVELGRRFPLASGAAGKVLLAFQPEKVQEALLKSFAADKSHAGVSVAALKRALKGVHRDGYAISVNEMRLGASAVAAPVWDHAGRVVAAITTVGPADRLPEKRLLELAGLVVQAANSLGRDLGWNGRPLVRSNQSTTDR